MKTIIVAASFMVIAHPAFAQKKDSLKSAVDFIIENENKRTTVPNVVKAEPKPIIPSGNLSTTSGKKKCCLFCKKNKK